MKKMNFSYVYLILLILSIGILGFATVSGVAAAEPNITSSDQSSVLSMKKMGVSVLKNGDVVSTIVYNSGTGKWDKEESDGDVFGEDASLKVGDTLNASFQIANNNNGEEDKMINVYTRVIIYKYWTEENENGEQVKDFYADPTKIHVLLKNVSGGTVNDELGWIMTGSDETASGTWLLDSQTDEKIILYYNSMLEPGDISDVFMSGLQIDGTIKQEYETVYIDQDHTVTGYDYLYDGKLFMIEIELDAVQDHSAKEAIKAAWGRNVTVSDGMLTLN